MNKFSNKFKINYNIVILVVILISVLTIIQNKILVNQEFYNRYDKLCKTIDTIDLDETIYDLEKDMKLSEALTLEGIYEYKRDNIEKSKEKFELSLENKKRKTNYLAMYHSNKYLYEIYKEEDNIKKAKTYLIKAYEAIPRREYDANCVDLNDLIVSTYDKEEFREISIKQIKLIISTKGSISPQTELYLRERLKNLYIFSNRYAEATNSLIDSILISKEIDSNYSLANSMISLGIVISELGGYDASVNLIEEAMQLDIAYESKNAFIKTYGYLNLAFIEFYYKDNPNKSIEILSSIEKYRDKFSEEDFRDIEIYKLIYEGSSYILSKNYESAKKSLDRAKELLSEDKYQYYINKERELDAAYARYYHAIGKYDTSLSKYKEVLKEIKLSNNKENEKNILNEMINLAKSMKDDELYYKYTQELLALAKEVESTKYHDYSVYIANSIKEKDEIENKHNQYIKSLIALFTSIIAIMIIYVYYSNRVKRLKHNSQYDGLTGVYNRKKFDIDYKSLLKSNIDFATMIFDIDNFKYINDTFGHEFGDVVLRESSNKIKNILPNTYDLYRYGGEEFVVLCIYEDKNDVIDMAEKIRHTMETINWSEDIKVTISIGVAFSDKEKENALNASDKNLYIAKKSGKNKVVY